MAIQRSNRSGGPKTAEGKLAISNNALKTGSYSSRAVLPGESEDDFKQLQDQFVKDFLPKNVAESLIVHQLSSLTWKILRLQKLEDAHVLRALHQPIGEGDLYRENLKLPYEYMSLIQDLSPYSDHFFLSRTKPILSISDASRTVTVFLKMNFTRCLKYILSSTRSWSAWHPHTPRPIRLLM